MIKLPPKQDKTPNSPENASGSVPFLNFRELSPTPVNCEVMQVRSNPPGGNNDVEVLLKHPIIGERIWGMRLNNPRLRDICEAWGEDESKWVGQFLPMHTTYDSFRRSTYIACTIPQKAVDQNPLPKPTAKK